MSGKNYYFLNLGCPKNQADGNHVRGMLGALGMVESETPEGVSFIVVNTCAFIEEARRETRGEIAELASFKRNGTRLVAIGCYPVLIDIKQEMPDIDAAFGLGQEYAFLQYVTGLQNIPGDILGCQPAVQDLPFAYLKISDGCDNRCSYCTIPLIRGPYRSLPVDDIFREGEILARRGARELVLVAQDTAVYGGDTGEVDLAGLSRKLAEIDGVDWIRVLYAHPGHLSAKLLEQVFAVDKVCRYLDIPIQHISPSILGRMNRPGGPERIRGIIKLARAIDKDVALRTTLMVGFPGETDDDFRMLVDFVEWAQFDYVGVFSFSPEQGTAANDVRDRVDPMLAGERREMLCDLAERISDAKSQALVGRQARLLIEGESVENVGHFEARSYRQAPGVDGYYIIADVGNMLAGQFVEATITDAGRATVHGSQKDPGGRPV